MLPQLAVVLVRPKYSENIGSVARACANMGCHRLIAVSPQGFRPERALPLATARGRKVLEGMEVVRTLPEALSSFHRAYATTARSGGWRKGILLPEEAAGAAAGEMGQGFRTAFVFGPEDNGLTNEEIEVCGRIVTIPTEPDAWSLNLSQAVLLVLYECFKQGPRPKGRYLASASSEPVTREEMQLLLGELKQRLLDIGFLSLESPDFFMLPVKRFLDRMELKRNEYNLLMGVCRQIGWALSRASRERGSQEGPDSRETPGSGG